MRRPPKRSVGGQFRGRGGRRKQQNGRMARLSPDPGRKKDLTIMAPHFPDYRIRAPASTGDQ